MDRKGRRVSEGRQGDTSVGKGGGGQTGDRERRLWTAEEDRGGLPVGRETGRQVFGQQGEREGRSEWRQTGWVGVEKGSKLKQGVRTESGHFFLNLLITDRTIKLI